MENQPAAPVSEYDKKIEQETASTLFQLVWGSVKSVATKAWTKAAVLKATQNYARHYRERFGEVKVLGLAKPIPLHQIYTAVRILEPQHLQAFTIVDDMEQQFKKQGRSRWQPYGCTTSDGIEVANTHCFLNILGAPGSGKSTFLRRLGQEAMLVHSGNQADSLSTNYQHPKLPVLIELRRFRQEPIDLIAAIQREFVICGFPDANAFVEKFLQQGRLLVLLDGLDEVPNDRLDEVIRVVKDFLDQYRGPEQDGNRFVMSCRTAHYRNHIPKFTDVVMADFSSQQIQKFAENWFSDFKERQEKTAQRLLERLNEPQHQQARELARTPLLLTFLCMTFQDRQDLPPTQATLYKAAFEILLHKWAAERRVHNEPIYAELTNELEVDMLAEMAASLFSEDRFFFSRQQAIDHIARFMKNELNAPKSLDADQILFAIEVQQGLIVRRAQDAYSFSHLTIQEYLTAREIWNAGPSDWQRCVREHLFDTRWSVVFVLMAGMGKADDLLLEMARHCERQWRSLVDVNNQLSKLDRWLREDFLPVDLSAGRTPQQLSACRAIYLGLAIALALARAVALARVHAHNYTRSRALDLAYALDPALDRSLGVAVALDRTLALDRPLARARAHDLARDRDRERAHARALDPALALVEVLQRTNTLTPQGIEHVRNQDRGLSFLESELAKDSPLSVMHNIIDMLEAWTLIVRCKNAAYRTTSQIWDEVCSRLFTLPQQ